MQSNRISRPRIVTGVFVWLLFGAAWTAPAQPGQSNASEFTALQAEVQRLSRELLQFRAELIEWRMQTLIAELRQVQAERQRLGIERQLIEREIGELNLASTNSPGAEDESRRDELANVQMPAPLAGEAAAKAREGALASALSTENTRITEIRQQLQHITSRPVRSTGVPNTQQR